MSDKSFGDYSNRNIVKNPLLSTAVVGLSLDELTHKAVLLPVSPTQGQTTKSEQHRPQNQTLGDANRDPIQPYGDTLTNINLSNNPLNKTQLDSQNNIKSNEFSNQSKTTLSKASAKSDDDFDVNEYFARLQGTRYVSAPIHSHIKEDPNANLQTEENLEEINLNESIEVQQSLTADIAQNFSQLPTVLPHVASAVFSSFSNMLNLRTKEQSGEVVQDARSDTSVPLMGVEEVAKELAPPPKEPPVMTGSNTYRLPTKKKYAQIPGLSSGDNQNVPFGSTFSNQTPSFFIPNEPVGAETVKADQVDNINAQASEITKYTNVDRTEISNIQTHMDLNKTDGTEIKTDIATHKVESQTNEQNAQIIPPPPMFSGARRDSQTTVGKSVLPPSVARRISANQPVMKQQNVVQHFHDNIFVPTVEESVKAISDVNVQAKTDLHFNLQTQLTKSLGMQATSKDNLDQSQSFNAVASNQDFSTVQPPLQYKDTSQTISNQSAYNIPGNPPNMSAPLFFTPDSSKSFISVPESSLENTSVSAKYSASSSFMPTSANMPVANQPVTLFTPQVDSNMPTFTNVMPSSTKVMPPSTSVIPNSTMIPTGSLPKGVTLFTPQAPTEISTSIKTMKPSSNLMLTANQPKDPVTFYTPTNMPVSANVMPPSSNTMPNMPPLSTKIPTENVPENPVTFFTPQAFQNQPSLPIPNEPKPLLPNVPNEPAKPLMEPPKSTSNVNFRMTKKRPQYYSGPIEGVGSISNNVKPVIPTALPPTNISQTNFFTPEPVTDMASNLEANMAHNVSPATLQTVPLQASCEATESYTAPFDINQVSQNITPYPALDMSQPNQGGSFTQGYATNTAFDLSRATTDKYEEPKKESAFGIIGSLKSKLSSIDINKIQNTVTNFFDPAYNDAKVTEQNAQQNVPYQQSYEQNNFNVFVPNVENQQSQTAYNYDYYQNQYNYGQNVYPSNSFYIEQNVQQYSSPETMNYNANANQNIPYDNYSQYNVNTQENINTHAENLVKESVQTNVTEITSTFSGSTEATNKYDGSNFGLEVNADNAKESSADSFKPHDSVKSNDFNNPITFYNVNPTDAQTEANVNEGIFKQHNLITEAANFFDTPAIGEQSAVESKANEVFKPQKAEVEGFNITDSFSNLTIDNTKSDQTDVLHSNIEAFQTNAGNIEAPILLNTSAAKKEVIETSKESNLMESLSKTDMPIIGVSSVPLFGLSAIIADRSREIADNAEQEKVNLSSSMFNKESNVSFFENLKYKKDILNITDVKNVLLIEPPQENICTVLKQSASNIINEEPDVKRITNIGSPISKDNANKIFDGKTSFFEHITPKEDINDEVKQVDDSLSICETCREVNSPVDRETEDLTSQLIDNITAPIQLSNPVGVPLAEKSSDIPASVDNDEQLDEITNITEDTFEVLQVQSATELLDTQSNVKSYGWNQDFTPTNMFNIESKEYGFEAAQNFDFKIDPNSIGFFSNNSLFFDNVPNNASDEIKAEYQSSHDDVLPRQMSIPSAPPAEEDGKSDETGGLDVHSIEQDANKDFPIEEFVIEPSETDDDKMEFRERKKSSEESSVCDTFTNRVERFQKESEYEHNHSYCAPKSMASYFDTGNYAVETHYKNTYSSHGFGGNIMRIPPGFEEEYKRRMSAISACSSDPPSIPDTSTQTRHTDTPTYSRAKTPDIMTTQIPTFAQTFGDRNVVLTSNTTVTPPAISQITAQFGEKIAEATIPNVKTENVASIFNIATNIDPNENVASIALEKDKATHGISESIAPATIKVATAPNIIENIGTPIEAFKDTKNITQLPDPINFFATNDPGSSNTETNRLASYFSEPAAKTDHTKSFFELSQSQNHYRHATKTIENPNQNTQNLDPNTRQNIADLMQDLTSSRHIEVQKDQTVKNVNYFSFEIDIKPDFNLKNVKEFVDAKPTPIDDSDEKVDSKKDVLDVTNNCLYCSSILNSQYKVRKAVNEGGEKEKEIKEDNNSVLTPNMNRKGLPKEQGYNIDQNPDEEVTIVQESNASEYSPVKHHWFYRVDVEDKSVWRGFSLADSNALEEAFNRPDLSDNTLVATDGGRYDVNVVGRLRIAVYWKEKPTNVRRCSWFYKGTTDARYVPYTEQVAEKLEEEYRHGITTGEWHRKLSLPNNEMVIMHGPTVMVHFLSGGAADAFTSPTILLGKKVYRNPPKIKVASDQLMSIDHLLFMVHGAGEYKRNTDPSSRPRVVRRGHEESEIEDSSPSSIEHLLLLCHGVGSACDMRFRSLEEVVEDFRSTSLQLLQSHYKNSYDNGIVNRVEVLPISWHAQLHAGEAGVDHRLSRVTLDSIPRLRAFTNHTVLDVLFYTSPVYHQTIMDTVCSELNRIYSLFRQRNPDFKGGVSLGGHSLGSVILYDLLCHQKPEEPLKCCSSSADKTYLPGINNNENISYPVLEFAPDALYALGSPIAIFECIRGVESLGLDFCLPTCKKFFNIFHPYDPIAYRIEPLINPQLQDVKPYLIPHHKGRKRMHLELKDTMARVGADLKQKLIESLRTTWNKWKSTPPPAGQLEKVVEEEMEKEQLCDDSKDETQHNIDMCGPEALGRLNDGCRVDCVLQEAPLEMINEYLFAMSSHVGYWESEDTMLLILREIYSSLGVQPDSTLPQQTLTVNRTKTLEETTVTNINEREYPSTSKTNI